MREAPHVRQSFLLPGLEAVGASGGLDTASREQNLIAGMIELTGLAGMIEDGLKSTPEALPFKTAEALTDELVEIYGATIRNDPEGNLVMSLCGVEGASYGGPRLAMLRNWQLKARYLSKGATA